MDLKMQYLQFLKKYSGVLGGMAGAAISTSLDIPPELKILSVGHTALLITSISDFAESLMIKEIPERERIKIVAVLEAARIKMNENLEKGKKVRDDDFFDKSIFERSGFEEMLEGLVYAATEENQAKKIKYYGNLLGNIVFNETIDRDYAHFLKTLAEKLSYRQFCQIYIIKSFFGWPGMVNFRNQDPWKMENENAFAEIFELHNLGIFEFSLKVEFFNLTRLWRDRAKLRKIGHDLFELMELKVLDLKDLKNYGSQLSLKHQ